MGGGVVALGAAQVPDEGGAGGRDPPSGQLGTRLLPGLTVSTEVP